MFGRTELNSLRDLYLYELMDAYDFEHQLLDALVEMEKSAHSYALKDAFHSHREETQDQVRRLEQVFNNLDERPVRRTCKGMKGLLSEGHEFIKARGDIATIDASLIAAAQRVEHYEIAVYGTLRNFALALGREGDAVLHQQTLDEESRADHTLTDIANSWINHGAATAAVSGNGTSGPS